MLYNIPNTGKPGATTKITCGDTVDNLEDEFTNAAGQPAIGAFITVEDNSIRFTMGGNISTPTYPPTQGAAGLGHEMAATSSIVLSNGAQVRTFQFINAANGSDAILQVTPFFE
jgi:hypothetical protein